MKTPFQNQFILTKENIKKVEDLLVKEYQQKIKIVIMVSKKEDNEKITEEFKKLEAIKKELEPYEEFAKAFYLR